MVSRGKLSLVRDVPAHMSVKCQAFNTYKDLCTYIHKEGGRKGGEEAGGISHRRPPPSNCKGKVWRL